MKTMNYACSIDSDDKLGKVVPTVRDKLLKGFIELLYKVFYYIAHALQDFLTACQKRGWILQILEATIILSRKTICIRKLDTTRQQYIRGNQPISLSPNNSHKCNKLVYYYFFHIYLFIHIPKYFQTEFTQISALHMLSYNTDIRTWTPFH